MLEEVYETLVMILFYFVSFSTVMKSEFSITFFIFLNNLIFSLLVKEKIIF